MVIRPDILLLGEEGDGGGDRGSSVLDSVFTDPQSSQTNIDLHETRENKCTIPTHESTSSACEHVERMRARQMRAQPWSVEAAFDTLTNHPLLNFVCAGFAVSDAVPRSTRAKSNAASKAAFIVGQGTTPRERIVHVKSHLNLNYEVSAEN